MGARFHGFLAIVKGAPRHNGIPLQRASAATLTNKVYLQRRGIVSTLATMNEFHAETWKARREFHRSVQYVAWFFALALCFNFAVAQDTSDVREKVEQIDQLRDAGKFREAVPIAEEVLKYCEKK